jgi:GTP cyclohydrolase I
MIPNLQAVQDLEIQEHDSEAQQQLGELAGSLILKAGGEVVLREGIERTPKRFAKALAHITQGYHLTPEEAVGEGIFPSEGRGLVSVKDIEFYSLCEHHLLPFWGKASVAYYPGEKILGLSKLPRILDVFARRFQVQERITRQVAEAVDRLIHPRAVAVKVRACHMCMMMRGVEKQQSETTTEYALRVESLPAHEASRLWQSLESQP